MTTGAIHADYNDYIGLRGGMPTSVRLDPAVDARLESLARITGRSKAFYLRELIEQGLDDLEDAYLGAAALEAHR
ncbi:type II toxin-antitoxin system RelB family antitoxin [Synechococcus lacustris]|uniref:type II toxin-antitoxin system RelB family antitoxin n=1 Tax=Synechococcus lacustris TaxID=2116544 RepID=UPI001F4EF9CC|nr:ribbon-helix-helix protein, CopG family [Synechococcus lacustris]